MVHPSRVAGETFMGTLRAMALRVGAKAYVQQQKIIMSRPDSRGELGAIGCPTLVLCGRQDVLTPPELSQETAEGTPGAQLVLIDDCNHYTSMERP